MKYRRHRHLVIEPVADRFLVFDRKRYRPHVLNRQAVDILRKSDGRTPVEAMAADMCRQYEVDFDRALEDIQKIYRTFVENELVRSVR